MRERSRYVDFMLRSGVWNEDAYEKSCHNHEFMRRSEIDNTNYKSGHSLKLEKFQSISRIFNMSETKNRKPYFNFDSCTPFGPYLKTISSSLSILRLSCDKL